MSDPGLVILKFGGSVLRDEASLGGAVHEVYRWRRDGRRVLAVVSALAGRTDELLARASRLGLGAASRARAALAAGGELESAALLAALLERSGVPAACLPAGIVAHGPGHDATPVATRTRLLRDALARLGVVVCPGYIAADTRGETVLLGRGGSDLTALCLAQALGAGRCILVKDVDGLYDRDPALAGPAARRYLAAGWDDALATDGSIIQHKAVRFAQRHRLGFELGALNATGWTRIGAERARTCPAAARPVPLRVAVLGHGVVGGGVARLLADDPARFTLVGVAARDPGRHRAPVPVCARPHDLLRDDIDAVVEVMGGTGQAFAVVAAALERGLSVVTANKDLMAAHGARLQALAAAHGGRLLASAAVGGALPVLESLARPGAAPLAALTGVLNGTANYVLEQLDAGRSLGSALAEARRLGFAEADPSRDLDGRDAAAKLCTAALACGARLREDDVEREPLTEGGWRPGLRQVATLRQRRGSWRASVRLVRPAPRSALGRAEGGQNIVVIRRQDGSIETLRGAGAGRWPTAEAVFGDLWQLARGTNEAAPGPWAGPGAANGQGQATQNALTTPSAARPVEASLS